MSKSRNKKKSNTDNPKQEAETTDVGNTGNYLRTLRMGRGLSIKDVTEATRISETNLNAIEDQNYSALPANTFTRGLLTIYAEFLGADTELIVTKFMEERDETPSQKRRPIIKQSRKILKPKRLAEPSHVSSMTMAGILLLVIVVTFTGYCVYTSWNPFSFLMKESSQITTVMKNVFPKEQPLENMDSHEKILPLPAENPPESINEVSPVVPEPSPPPALPDIAEDSVPPETQSELATDPAPEPETEVQTGIEVEGVTGDITDAPGVEQPIIPEENIIQQETMVEAEKDSEDISTIDQSPPETLASQEPTDPSQKTDITETSYIVITRFVEDTQLEFTGDSGETVVKEFLAGDYQSWPASASLTMTFSRPDSAKILVNGSSVDFPGPVDGIYTLRIPQDIQDTQPDE